MNYLTKDIFCRNEFYNGSLNKLPLTAKQVSTMPVDGYTLTVRYDKTVVIEYSNQRAFRYAMRELKELCEKHKKTVPFIQICDYPDFPIRGIIEGFYGTPYSFSTRKSLIKFCDENKLNSYFYAPKDDLYHRDKWRELYSHKFLEELEKLIDACNEKLIDFWFCISPGKDFCFSDPNDYQILYEKISQVEKFCVCNFGLLMDDISMDLSETDKMNFNCTAKAQAHLANKTFEYLKAQNLSSRLVFCPTEYIEYFDTPYKQSLRENLNKSIKVFWTGYNTIAEKICTSESVEVKKTFGVETMIWDNYPVNDFEPKGRIYMGAITNRSQDLYKIHSGYIINPMEKWYASQIAVLTMAHFGWNGAKYDAEKSLRIAVNSIANENDLDKKAFMVFVEANKSNVMRISKLDQNLKKWWDSENFDKLSHYYEKLLQAVNILSDARDSELKAEIEMHIKNIRAECEIFFSLPNIDEKIFSEFILFKERGSNQFLSEYIKRKKLFLDYNGIKIDEPRKNYWEFQQMHPNGFKK
ncbi:MAG: protein O-GlcNAcase [Firmicutes bacterium]|nr:protein O-GlcNAcase [Bacillota bacterium]